MTDNEILSTLKVFSDSRRSGCSACPNYNNCGTLTCQLAKEAAELIVSLKSKNESAN